MKYKPSNLKEKIDKIDKFWTPGIIAAFNDYHIKLAKIKGPFVWHLHDSTDEVFYVLSGQMEIEFRDKTVALNENDLFVVPRGIEHRPHAEEECHIMIIEPAGTVNTGNVLDDLTAGGDSWL